MKTPFITVLYLLVQATTLLAQGASDFILTKSGEQLAGEVFQPINPLREVHFKPIGSDKFQTYSAGELRGYQFKQHFFTACDIPAEGGSVFLLTLVNGTANLYGLPNKNTYYVEKNGTFHRLERKDRMIEDKLMEDHRYAGILKSLFADCALPDKIYEQMKFSPKSLIDATQRYNTCRDPNLNYAEKRKKAALPVSFGVGGGVSSSKAYHANSFNPYSKTSDTLIVIISWLKRFSVFRLPHPFS
ncbi:MAG: hypothetical protein IPN76_25030 [Saprospiraceae bacterium]|nr:hypothetical protein [Saprospiraceae bacterium]